MIIKKNKHTNISIKFASLGSEFFFIKLNKFIGKPLLKNAILYFTDFSTLQFHFCHLFLLCIIICYCQYFLQQCIHKSSTWSCCKTVLDTCQLKLVTVGRLGRSLKLCHFYQTFRSLDFLDFRRILLLFLGDMFEFVRVGVDLLGACVIGMFRVGGQRHILGILRIIIFFLIFAFLIAKGDMFFRFPCVETLVISFPFDVAILSI